MLDRLFDDGRVENVNVALSVSIVSANILRRFNCQLDGKTKFLHFRHFTLDETAELYTRDPK